ncbi:MAG: protein phosphatase 2C domain-containing protein [Oscillospiraceae bacterium]|nr:protein phosphatase 2C domain-containing protein [Oscillospiraceae bacterium]
MDEMNSGASFLEYADCIITVSKEKIPGEGEDSFCYLLCETGGMIGAFDGCGGAGARHYENCRNKTGAYLASRAVSGAVFHWFEQNCNTNSTEMQTDALKKTIVESIKVCKDNSGQQKRTLIKGQMLKEFPTTAAVAVCSMLDGMLEVNCFWAGDSRCYILQGDGLAQLTKDDVNSLDAFHNLSEDGTLQNLISASKEFDLHYAAFRISLPCVLIASTDGCFSYLPSPMAFEQLLIEKLLSVKKVSEFEEALCEELDRCSGDDFTFLAIPVGYGTFEQFQEAFRSRLKDLRDQYLPEKDSGISLEEKWNRYKNHYYQYMKSGVNDVDLPEMQGKE